MTTADASLKFTFLGTGTSHGIPMIGCSCPVCTSANPHNKRSRASVFIQTPQTHLLIDTSMDFRMQALTNHITKIDTVLLTHAHADHIFGFDDLRPFYHLSKKPVPVFGSEKTIKAMNRIFSYVHHDRPKGSSVLRVQFKIIEHEEITVNDLHIKPIPVEHSGEMINGYLIEWLNKGWRGAYIPDCKSIPDKSMALLKNLNLFVLDALRPDPHPTHLSLPETITIFQKVQADQSYITHIAHWLEHEETRKILPKNIHVPYDQLSLSFP